MTVKFLSEEWAQELKERLNASEAFTTALGAQSATIQQVIATEDGQAKYWLRIQDGTIDMGTGEIDSPDVTITQDYDTAVALARSELNAVTAFMTGKLKIDNLMKVMGLQGAFANLPVVMQEMDVDY